MALDPRRELDKLAALRAPKSALVKNMGGNGVGVADGPPPPPKSPGVVGVRAGNNGRPKKLLGLGVNSGLSGLGKVPKLGVGKLGKLDLSGLRPGGFSRPGNPGPPDGYPKPPDNPGPPPPPPPPDPDGGVYGGPDGGVVEEPPPPPPPPPDPGAPPPPPDSGVPPLNRRNPGGSVDPFKSSIKDYILQMLSGKISRYSPEDIENMKVQAFTAADGRREAAVNEANDQLIGSGLGRSSSLRADALLNAGAQAGSNYSNAVGNILTKTAGEAFDDKQRALKLALDWLAVNKRNGGGGGGYSEELPDLGDFPGDGLDDPGQGGDKPGILELAKRTVERKKAELERRARSGELSERGSKIVLGDEEGS